MKIHLSVALYLGALTLVLPALSQTSAEVKTIAFRDVSVIPMDTERVVLHQVVLVRDGKIVDLGPAESVHVPAGAVVIEGQGKFLAPGLADMHTHVDRKDMLPLFLAAGVTTILDMGNASPEFVTETRAKIQRGLVVGPRVFAAFMIDGPGDPGPEYVALCERDARGAVDRAKLVGYDFIKAYERLDPNVYAAVMDEARKQHIAVVGHIPPRVGLESALDQGQVMVAHGEEYYKTYFQDKPDESRIAPAVALTIKAGAYVTPNLSFFATLTELVSNPQLVDKRMAAPDMKLVPPDIRGGWLRSRSVKPSNIFVPELATIKKLTLAMSQAGVPLLAGTDTPGNLIPGSSLDDDLDQLVAAGLTPFQALAAATRTPGEFIHRYVPGAEEFGTIAPGRSADLVLLAANPLKDMRAMRTPLGVMVRGRWFTKQELKALTELPVPGYERVMKTEAVFEGNLMQRGAANAIRAFHAHGSVSDKLPASFLNSLGYQMISAKKLDEAIAVFVFYTNQYPDDWNAYDSLGEAYADKGRVDLAVASYRHSLALNSKNSGAVEVLRKMISAPANSR